MNTDLSKGQIVLSEISQYTPWTQSGPELQGFSYKISKKIVSNNIEPCLFS